MFRNRTNSQKPSDELYASFRQKFPGLCSSTAPTIDGDPASVARASDPNDNRNGGSSIAGGAVTAGLAGHDATRKPRRGDLIPEHDEMKNHDSTPQGNQDPWRFTPSLMDTNSFAFASLANQPPGYYTPTPGGTHTWYHNRAGDLHTPGMAMGIGTPLSLPTTADAVNVGSIGGVQGFAPAQLAANQFSTFRAFAGSGSFAPNLFDAQPDPRTTTSFEPMDASGNISPPSAGAAAVAESADTEMQDQPPSGPAFLSTFGAPMPAPPPPLPAHSSERFRFHVTLNAPTAMVKTADEIPVSYLNKGQAYSVSVVDTAPPASHLGPTRYRTVIRISFEDEQQRRRPAACWQLWKDGRGTNEAHQRGGRLQAVEYVEPASAEDDSAGAGASGGGRGKKSHRTELEHASLDGFSVYWTADAANADCSVAVRFNFLSTDFSHSKGVKGIPVRLCAKTEVMPLLPSLPSPPSPPSPATIEVCYCKVKLFRDHGAERKLSNDIAHVKKTIDKLKQQIAQAETGMQDFGKRKRTGSMMVTAVGKGGSGRPGKVPKHKRTWSISSAGSSGGGGGGGGGRGSIEGDLHLKLATVQDMFTSTRPVSVLHLRGEEADDPDLHPVQLPGESRDLSRVASADHQQQSQLQPQAAWDRRASGDTSHATATVTATSSRIVSPVSSASGHGFRAPAKMHSPRHTPADWGLFEAIAPAAGGLSSVDLQQLTSLPDQPAKKAKAGSDGLSEWIEALGVDPSYQPPPERTIKPVACFYVRPSSDSAAIPFQDPYYRAVYLSRRTPTDLVAAIAAKFGFDPERIERTVRTTRSGITLLVDDDVVREMPEGQDMLVELIPLKGPAATTTTATITAAATTTTATTAAVEGVPNKNPEQSHHHHHHQHLAQQVQAQDPVPVKRQWDSGAMDEQVDGDGDGDVDVDVPMSVVSMPRDADVPSTTAPASAPASAPAIAAPAAPTATPGSSKNAHPSVTSPPSELLLSRPEAVLSYELKLVF